MQREIWAIFDEEEAKIVAEIVNSLDGSPRRPAAALSLDRSTEGHFLKTF
jgi:hypothetical protein